MKPNSNSNPTDSTTIIIYCKMWCNYLKKLTAFLEEKHYPFMFIDIRFDLEKGKGLGLELGNFFLLPVIEINEALYEKPPISELEEIFSDIEKTEHIMY